ncbi:RNA-directed DNA polymerase, eukaryota [Tanacetum coccineum]
MEDRWVWDLNGEGVFWVKDVRILLDECFLPKAPTATRWVKYVPIKINVFAWKVFLDRLPTRSNLQHRGVLVSDLLCPLCSSAQEDSSHLFFSCRLATDIVRLVCRWWNLSWTPLGSYADWLNWFNSIRLSSKVKDLLEGVLYITWWSVWMFRNQLLFSSKAPRKDVIFDDIVSRSFTFPGEVKVYYNFDEGEDDTHNYYPLEFLNSLNVSGLPPHCLRLKIGCPIILLRNLDPANGLYNGTRLICKRFDPNVINAEIIVGQHAGVKGQTISNVGVYLPESVFSHGQLYVALSRGISRTTTKVLVKPEKEVDQPGVYTANVVYQEVLRDE